MSYRSDETELTICSVSTQAVLKGVQLTVNLKSAKALGLTMPPARLARANA
jgi:hypothetical protein